MAAFDGQLDPAVLDAAARRARRLGVGGDEVLRCAGILTPDQIARGVAARLGLAVDPLNRPFVPGSLAAECAGVLFRQDGDDASITVAARGTGIRWLAARIAREPGARAGLKIAAPERIASYVRAAASERLAQEAVHGLQAIHPHLSAKGRGFVPLHGLAILLVLGAALAGFAMPATAWIAAEYFLAVCFLSWTLLRIAACLLPSPSLPARDVPERFLPIYTVIVPLYREAAVAEKLVQALKRLRYPREKLDIKIVLEENDHETRAVIDKLMLHAPFEIIAPPRSGPQTKPKALAAALPFARGSFVTIYDAEDDPEPDQLYKAVAAFAAASSDLACVQAKLAIYNGTDGWFSRQFAAEYAGQFEVFLPALARLGLPLPLGGTSNHFRTSVLREVGGWDPFNVTEDADLGMRLARFGYRAATIDSTTWEEAPVSRRQWIGQRTRWIKGWAQTWIVHMRYPLRAFRELGLRGFLSLQLIGSSILSALVHPVFMLIVIHHAVTGELFSAAENLEHSVRKALALCVLGMGYFSTIALGIEGLRRRRMPGIAWVLVTVPAYWLLLSYAAWRAMKQLVSARYEWEKTAHGLARSTSRPPSHAERREPALRPVRDFVTSRPRPRRF